MEAALERVRGATRGSEYELDLWLVGGAVRDELLGRPPKADLDLVTTHPIEPLVALLSSLADHPPVVYARFGTAMLSIEGVQFEFVTARRESYDPESRKPSVKPATLTEDAERRDFTVNALLKNLQTGELLDPTGRGLADLKAKILRAPKDPESTFFDDPLRMLRAVRFRWQLNFDPADNLYPAIRQNANRIAVISAERYRDEFNKILLGPDPAKATADLMDLGLFHELVPEFEAMRYVDQGSYHHLDVWNHTLLVLQNLQSSKDLGLKLAAMLHDVGKPETRIIDKDGKVRFFNHEVVGERLAREILRRLKYPNDFIAEVAQLVRNHMRLGSAPVFTPTAARRLWRDLGPNVPRLLELVDADAHALKPGVRALNLEPIRAQLESVLAKTPPQTLESPLPGMQIMQILNLEPGPEVGKAKQFLLNLVLEGTLAPDDHKEAERLLREHYSTQERSRKS